jgi:Protein of unknown function (DUF1580)
MIESLSDDEVYTFPQVTQIVPFRPNVSTIWRWSSRGVGGIKLTTIRVGGRRYVTRRALDEFLCQLNRANGSNRAPSHARKQNIGSKSVLDQAGI